MQICVVQRSWVESRESGAQVVLVVLVDKRPLSRGTNDVGPPVVRQETTLAVRSATARYTNSDIYVKDATEINNGQRDYAHSTSGRIPWHLRRTNIY